MPKKGNHMKREDIKKFFENATDDQIKALLDINSGDITNALDKQKTETDKLKGDLVAANAATTKANETITALEKSKGDTVELQKQIDAYKAADEQRKKDEDATNARKETETRLDAAVGEERKFLHGLVRDGVVGEFAKALADPTYKGKSDKEIFDTISKDKDWFATQNPPAGGGMGGMGGGSGADKIDARAVMGLPPLDATKK